VPCRQAYSARCGVVSRRAIAAAALRGPLVARRVVCSAARNTCASAAGASAFHVSACVRTPEWSRLQRRRPSTLTSGTTAFSMRALTAGISTSMRRLKSGICTHAREGDSGTVCGAGSGHAGAVHGAAHAADDAGARMGWHCGVERRRRALCERCAAVSASAGAVISVTRGGRSCGMPCSSVPAVSTARRWCLVAAARGRLAALVHKREEIAFLHGTAWCCGVETLPPGQPVLSTHRLQIPRPRHEPAGHRERARAENRAKHQRPR